MELAPLLFAFRAPVPGSPPEIPLPSPRPTRHTACFRNHHDVVSCLFGSPEAPSGTQCITCIVIVCIDIVYLLWLIASRPPRSGHDYEHRTACCFPRSEIPRH